ncbi:MAG: hypothetical protein R3B49_12105, partial [Phycisphaerales bacterium]
MGIYDREYVRTTRSAPRPMGRAVAPSNRLRMVSVNTWLIIINAAIFAIGAFSPYLKDLLEQYGHFSTYWGFG